MRKKVRKEQERQHLSKFADMFQQTLSHVPKGIYHDASSHTSQEEDELNSPRSDDSTFKNKEVIKKLKADILVTKL